MKKEILAIFAKMWEIQGTLTHNPSPNPVSLRRENLPEITQNNYVVARKTDGVRYNLLLANFSQSGQPFSAMIDRSLVVYQVEVFAKKFYFDGTLLDGELVWNEKRHCLNYFVFDVMMVSGNNVSQKNLIQRFEIINKLFPSEEGGWDSDAIRDKPLERARVLAENDKIVAAPHRSNLLFMYSKPCVHTSSMGMLERQSSSHACDGYVFTPIDMGVRRNRHKQLFKWKPDPTIDLRCLKEETSDLQLLCGEGKNEFDVQEKIPEWQFSVDLNALMKATQTLNSIVEFQIRVNPTDKQVWCAVHRVRSDKASPNDVKTILGIIAETQENISVRELLSLVQDTSNEVFTA